MPYFVVDECPVTKRSCELTVEALSSHMNGTETVVKAVHCSKHYGAALLSNGRLVLLAQGSPKYHGSIVEHGADNVNDVAAGDTHIVFCKSDGTVYSFGYSNTYGQLGDGTVWASCTREDEPGGDGPPVLSSPQMIRGFGRGKLNIDEGDVVEGKRVCVPIASVACGSHHTLLLTRHGNAVYCCGHGLDGQLGGKRRPALQPSFKSIRLLFGLPIKQVAAAGKHSFVLLQTGKLLAFGNNTSGQLGIGSTKTVGTPTEVSIRGSTHLTKDGRKPLDSYAVQTLRAPWGSVESMYFPLRVERINPDVAQGEPCVVAVWCSANRTVLLTSEMEWLSCGLPISRSPCGMSGQWQRMDRYGALGRWIKHCGEAYTFGKMQWSNKVKAAVESLALSPTEESSLDAVLNSIHLFCSNHIVALLVPGNHENCKSLLFVQGEKPNVQIVHNGERTPIAAIAGADKLLQDCTVDDDSYVYPLSKGHAIVACDHFVVVL